MKIIIVNQTNCVIQSSFKKVIETILFELSELRFRNKKYFITNQNEMELTWVFVEAHAMKKINFQFRKKNKPTDVLSFAPIEEQSFGELVFCLDVLKQQAKQYNHSLEIEFLYMLIHGLFHLLGYDHELSKKEEKLMFTLQDRVFNQIKTKYSRKSYFKMTK